MNVFFTVRHLKTDRANIKSKGNYDMITRPPRFLTNPFNFHLTLQPYPSRLTIIAVKNQKYALRPTADRVKIKVKAF